MEKPELNKVFEDLALKEGISELFTAEDLLKLADELVLAIKEILEGRKVKEIIFEEGEAMFFRLDDNTIHIGLGVLQRMIRVWTETALRRDEEIPDPENLKKIVRATIRSDAAHEAGHRVIELRPIEDLGIERETWGQFGFSSLANALMDCRNDQRIMRDYPHLEGDMRAGVDFGFGPGGRVDWPGDWEKSTMRLGYVPLFNQFDAEAMRIWAEGSPHALTDPRVIKMLEEHRADIMFVAKDKACSPKKNPSTTETRAKARKAYLKIAEIFNGKYRELLDRDRDNQAIHQALTIIGIKETGEKIPEKLEKLLEDVLETMPEPVNKELNEKLELQKREKDTYLKMKDLPLWIAGQQGRIIKKQAGFYDLGGPEAQPEKAKPAGAQPPEEQPVEAKPAPPDLLEQLGPAIRAEELSGELREFLKKLFKDMADAMVQDMMNHLLGQLLENLLANPEKALKELEDAFNEQIRPHTVPSTVPTHKELEEQAAKLQPQAKPAKLIHPGESGLIPAKELAYATPRELEETEKWLEENMDMKERIEAWRDAIFSVTRGERRKTARTKPRLYWKELVKDEQRKQVGQEKEGKIFMDTKAEKREKITLSVLWRTQAVSMKEALKLMLFLAKIFEDEEIRKHLDLEILVSQEIPGGTDVSGKNIAETGETKMPVIISFGQDPITDHDQIMRNLLAVQKAGGVPAIVQDADALKLQRERLLAWNPGAKRKFAIDLWDEAAIQTGVTSPMEAVKEQIAETQERLRGHAFCFVLKEAGAGKETPAAAYGEENFLVENGTEKLIRYLDIVVRTMIQYPDTYASHIKQRIEQELNIFLP